MRLLRATLIESVLMMLKPSDANDLPMIRQAINDESDAARKDGFSVRDFDQDRMVADIQKELRQP